MKTDWDYTNHASAYLHRPSYSEEAISKFVEAAGLKSGDPVCDVGAGCAHLTIPLAERGFNVTAIEPNDDMRAHGMERTKDYSNVRWVEATMEETTMEDNAFAATTFGSCFGVTDRANTLHEMKRILKDGGWFACMWNHRDFSDTLQSEIENHIRTSIEGYDYGVRRADQTDAINESGLFTEVMKVEAPILHKQSAESWIEAWRSHMTLKRQAKEQFGQIVDHIEKIVRQLNQDVLDLPYVTRMYYAQLKS